MKDEIQTQDVVRKASGAQMEAINGIKEGMIGDGKGISLGEGDMAVLCPDSNRCLFRRNIAVFSIFYIERNMVYVSLFGLCHSQIDSNGWQWKQHPARRKTECREGCRGRKDL